jgi:hypothetical protein
MSLRWDVNLSCPVFRPWGQVDRLSWQLLSPDPRYKTPWPESENELYQPIDRRLSAKLVSSFVKTSNMSSSMRCDFFVLVDNLLSYTLSTVFQVFQHVVFLEMWVFVLNLFSASRPEPLHFVPSSSSIVLTKLSGLLSRPTASQKIW